MNGGSASILRAALIGGAYFLGAHLGVTQTITPEGIAILWPPNAIALATFLLLPRSQWSLPMLAIVVAELLADVPHFPPWAALAFAAANLFEAALAATMIRKFAGAAPLFTRLRGAAAFLLFGPGLASAVAGLLGAWVYVRLDAGGTYWSLWRIWWFGDALGLLLLTPLVVAAWHAWHDGLRAYPWRRAAELALVWLLLAGLGQRIFSPSEAPGLEFSFTPILLLPLCAWIAVRMAVVETAATLVLVGVIVTGYMVHGGYPDLNIAPQHAVWMMQEYLAVVAVLSVGLSVLMEEIRQQRLQLKIHERAAVDSLLEQNEMLEARVAQRTRSLEENKLALEEANRKLEYLASVDTLTGVSNRRHFRELAQREMQRCATAGRPLALLMFDIDRFKEVNDVYGHEAGDAVLCGIIAASARTIRPLDLIGRFGGEEFLVLLPEADLEQACDIAERMRTAIAGTRVDFAGVAIGVTASFGVGIWNGRDTYDSLVQDADKALYAAKDAGRNQTRTFD